MAKLRRFLVFLAIAFSFGGFTFYAAVVVPIGGAVLGKTTQGFVTRQVTHVINAATALTLALLVWEAFAERTHRTRAANRALATFVAAIFACYLVLVALYTRLDLFLDPDNLTVNDHDTFYGLHRIYLWTSAVQWLLWFPLVWIVLCGRPTDNGLSKS